MRLILIDAKTRIYAVYQGRKLIAKYRAMPDEPLLSAEEIETMRIIDHPVREGDANERL